MSENLIEIGMFIAYGLAGLAVVAAILFPLVHIVKDIKKAKGTFIGIAVLAAVLLIAYATTTGQPYENVSETASRWISAGILSVFILAGLTIVAAIFTEVVKMFK